jgi:hypothetical protein
LDCNNAPQHLLCPHDIRRAERGITAGLQHRRIVAEAAPYNPMSHQPVRPNAMEHDASYAQVVVTRRLRDDDVAVPDQREHAPPARPEADAASSPENRIGKLGELPSRHVHFTLHAAAPGLRE